MRCGLMVLSPHVQLGNTIVPILLRSVLLLCHLSAVSAQQRLATNVDCLPYRSDEALFSTSGAKHPNCSPHRPPTERARIVQWPVPQMRSCCTTTWAALPVPTARYLLLVSVMTPSDAHHRCRSSATSALLASIQSALVRHWTTCATRESVRAGPEPTRSPLGPACPSAHLARRAQSSETSSPPRVPPPWGPRPSTCTLRTPLITPIGCAPPPRTCPSRASGHRSAHRVTLPSRVRIRRAALKRAIRRYR